MGLIVLTIERKGKRHDLSKDQKNKKRLAGLPVEINAKRLQVWDQFVLEMVSISVHANRMEQSGDLQKP